VPILEGLACDTCRGERTYVIDSLIALVAFGVFKSSRVRELANLFAGSFAFHRERLLCFLYTREYTWSVRVV